nr:CASP-like protein 4A2 [Bubalus bubalis]
MSRVPAGGHRPAGQLGGSAAEAPLRPPRPPARPLCARQRRHLGAGSAGRAATGRREGHGSAAHEVRGYGAPRGPRECGARGARLRGAARATGVRRARCAATGRRESHGSAAREVRGYGAPRGSPEYGSRAQSGSPSAPPPGTPLLTLAPEPQDPDPHRAPPLPCRLPHVMPRIRVPSAPRIPGKMFIWG